VCKQLRVSGMMEAVKIRSAGYAIRINFEEFFKRYKICLMQNALDFKVKNSKEGCNAILKAVFGTNSIMDGKYQLGLTKVFLKEDARSFLEINFEE
jgi:myosin heavy subunit